MKTVAEIIIYIQRHEAVMHSRPTAIGLLYDDYIAVIREMGGDGRCTNINAHIMGIPVVRV